MKTGLPSGKVIFDGIRKMTLIGLPSFCPNGDAINAADTSRPRMTKSFADASESINRRDSMDDVGLDTMRSLADSCPFAISLATNRMRTLVGSFSTHTHLVVIGEMFQRRQSSLASFSSRRRPTFCEVMEDVSVFIPSQDNSQLRYRPSASLRTYPG